jgi:hypothetical protein
MDIRIANAGQQNLSVVVSQLESAKDSNELRTGPNKKTKVVELYVKNSGSMGKLASAKTVTDRTTHQHNAREDIRNALIKEFPGVANKVITNMVAFFEGNSKVTVSDARAVLEKAKTEASNSVAVVSRRTELLSNAADFREELDNLEEIDILRKVNETQAEAAKINMAAEVGNSKTLASQAVTGMMKDPLALVELLRLQPAGSPMLAVLDADISGIKEMHNFIVKFDAAMAQSTLADKNTALRNLHETAVKQSSSSSISGVGNPFEVNLTGDGTGKRALSNCENAYAQGTDMTQAMQSVKTYLVTTTGSMDSGMQSPIKQFAAALAASPLLED